MIFILILWRKREGDMKRKKKELLIIKRKEKDKYAFGEKKIKIDELRNILPR